MPIFAHTQSASEKQANEIVQWLLEKSNIYDVINCCSKCIGHSQHTSKVQCLIGSISESFCMSNERLRMNSLIYMLSHMRI